MIVVNFFGPPSSGKSSSAFVCTAYLKNRACDVDLVQEYAKERVYRNEKVDNQIEIFAEQYTRQLTKQLGGVPMVITDSPLLLTRYYGQGRPCSKELNELASAAFNTFENINVLVKRVKPYNTSGRYQTEAESDAMFNDIAALVPRWDYIIKGEEEDQLLLAQVLLETYGKRISINR